MQLRVAEQYVDRFGELAKQANSLVIPANLSDIASMLALATRIVGGNGSAGPAAPGPAGPPPRARL